MGLNRVFRIKGQALTEFIIIMPLFFALLLGVFEMAYVYRAKALLNTATFEAARAGSLNHAKKNPMRESLVSGMIAEFMRGDRSAGGLVKAYVKAKAFETIINKGRPTISIISPTKEIFDKFSVKRKVILANESRERNIKIMPNDNLNFRSTKLENVRINGKDQKINIQDANLLKVKSFWCYELKVPILKNLIVQVAEGRFGLGTASPEQRVCSLGGKLASAAGSSKTSRYLAITSQAVVRMQTPVVF